MALRSSTGEMGAATAMPNAMVATAAGTRLRRCTNAMAKTSGTAAASNIATAGRVARASPPARPAQRASLIVGRRRRCAPASSITVKKKRNSESGRIWVLNTMSVTDTAARIPAINPKRGEKGAGCGVDHRLNERDRAGSVAEYMLDAGEQQRIKRHAVGHRR